VIAAIYEDLVGAEVRYRKTLQAPFVFKLCRQPDIAFLKKHDTRSRRPTTILDVMVRLMSSVGLMEVFGGHFDHNHAYDRALPAKGDRT